MIEKTVPPLEKIKPEDSQNKSESIVKNPESPNAEKTLEKKIMESWNKRDGEFSEVIDSEGHRVRINHY